MATDGGTSITEAALARQLASERLLLTTLGILLLNWAVILGVFYLVGHEPFWPVFVAGFLVIAVEQHCLGLWMHEGGHWLIAGNRSLNDALVMVFLSGPLYVPLHAYRGRHLLHHAHLGTPLDTKPVIFTRIDGRHFAAFLLRNCLGLQLVQIAREYLNAAPTARRYRADCLRDALPVLAVQSLLIVVLIALDTPWPDYLFFWLLPWLTANRFLAGLRSVIEHQPLGDESHPFVRPLRPTLFDRLVFCRAGFEYHWLHHRHPNVPCFNLRRVDVAIGAAVEPRLSYLGALRSLIQRRAPAAGID